LLVSAIVPLAFGKEIVLSAVGSIEVKVVSNPFAVAPSKITWLLTLTAVLLIVVVVPFTVRFPVIVRSPAFVCAVAEVSSKPASPAV